MQNNHSADRIPSGDINSIIKREFGTKEEKHVSIDGQVTQAYLQKD